MKNNYYYFGVILDRSGSMSGSKIVEARNSFNNIIKEQQNKDYQADIYITIFDDKIETLYQGDIKNCIELTENNFSARGMTNLYDAIGKTVTEIGYILNNKPEDERPEKVKIVIITDGQENNSKEYNKILLKRIIEEQKTKYSWEFMFMGCDENTINDAYNYGIIKSVIYGNNDIGVRHAYACTNNFLNGK